MSSFTEPLTVTKVVEGKKDYWITARSFRYYVGSENSEDYIDVPEGTKTDFASVPRIFWTILPPDGVYSQAAVVHDFLYKNHQRTREQSDEVFLEAMRVLGVEEWKAQTMFWAVRIFGKIAWDRKK